MKLTPPKSQKRVIIKSLLISMLIVSVSAEADTETSAAVSIDSFIYNDQGPFADPDSKEYGISISAEAETKYRSDDGDTTVVFKPFYRWDKNNKERDHWDIRQLDASVKDEGWELKAGVSKEFWGAAESQHLVDIINQVDSLEGIEEEEKLGQPMVKLSHKSGNGTFEAYVLPYFREREFTDKKGYLRSPGIIDTSQTTYESAKKERHVDYALRWSESIGKLDSGIYFFSGTDRKPELKVVGEKNGIPILAPHYKQTKQIGVDLQYTAEESLWKLEAIFREYAAAVVGIEYNLPVMDSGMEMSLLAEYHKDSRGKVVDARLQNDLFAGARLSFNDISGTEILAGAFVDLDDTNEQSLRIEAGRRIDETTKINLKAQLSRNSVTNDPFRVDDYLELSIKKFLF